MLRTKRALMLSGPGFDPDAVAHRAAVFAAGGAMSGQRFACNTMLIRALKSCGAWYQRDDYAALCGENITQAKITLKLRNNMSVVSSPTFVPDRGFLGNRAGYLDTLWVPTSLTQYTDNNASYGFYCYSAPTVANDRVMGCDSNNYSEVVVSATQVVWSINAGAPTAYASAGWPPGFHNFERASSGNCAAYLNNVQKQNPNVASIALVNRSFYALAGHLSTGVYQPGNAGLSSLHVGGALTANAKAGEYAAWRTFFNQVGVP